MSKPRVYYIRLEDLEKPPSPLKASYAMCHYHAYADLESKMERQLDTTKVVCVSLFLSGISLGFSIAYAILKLTQ
ncbi:MAG: hypothetical protein EBU83_01990 [bacterium]|nr:hypothetical protein [Candidatus Aquidulcis sp.]